MKYAHPLLAALTRKICLIGLIGTCSLSIVKAQPPPSSFGVWDRGSSFDPQEYPFLKGSSFNAPWADVERQAGVFDWSELDQAVEKVFQNKSYMYLSLGVGPEAPEWIYEHGVPKVFTDDTRHLNKWKYYPYYLATAAFCALHKGLDAADTKAYPEEKFGKATPKNADRMLKICKEFSKYGAGVDDKDALTIGQVEQRRDQQGFNDVGWRIWPDNYARFLNQIDADATSVPCGGSEDRSPGLPQSIPGSPAGLNTHPEGMPCISNSTTIFSKRTSPRQSRFNWSGMTSRQALPGNWFTMPVNQP